MHPLYSRVVIPSGSLQVKHSVTPDSDSESRDDDISRLEDPTVRKDGPLTCGCSLVRVESEIIRLGSSKGDRAKSPLRKLSTAEGDPFASTPGRQT